MTNPLCSLRIRMIDPEKPYPILVSACLLGIRCRYDAEHSLCQELVDFLPRVCIVPVCPEQMGGLPTPRPAVNIIGGHGPDVLSGKAKCVNQLNEDVTEAFVKGAQEALKLAQLTGARIFIGKDKSPSCGMRTPYCDVPEGTGTGVTVALLEKEGLEVLELRPQGPFPSPEFDEVIKKTYK